MRSRQEIESELRSKEEMLGTSEELDANVRPYVQALEWVLSGEADQIGALRVSEWNDHNVAILSARTHDGKLLLNERTDAEGVYSLLRYEL